MAGISVKSSRRSLSSEDSEESPISVCALCLVHHEYMTRVSKWHSQESQEIALRYGIIEQDLVCRPCRDDIRRLSSNPEFVPRWGKKRSQNDNVLCAQMF